MKNQLTLAPKLLCFCILHFALCLQTWAQGTAFTYQGRLNDNGAPANGSYDLRFALHDAAAAGNEVGGPLTNSPVAVTNGLFVTTLDFGVNVFTGANRWLEIGVRTNGSSDAFTTLNPRQPLTPAPYALYAPSAGTAATASSVAPGSVTGAGIANGTIGSANVASGQVVKSLNSLKDDVTLVAGANIAITPNGNTLQLSASDAARWSLVGNAGTTPGVNFLGTTDNQPVELKANGQRVLRLEPTITAPNIIAGYKDNQATLGVVGATIGGGGASNLNNVVAANYASVLGGISNLASGVQSAVGGGGHNQAGGRSAFVGGGGGFDASGGGPYPNSANGDWSLVGGGWYNRALGYSSVIGGGGVNLVETDTLFSSIVGGYGNLIQTNASQSVIAGGYFNIIQPDAAFSSVGGGEGNANSSPHSVIGGGANNLIQTNSSLSVIAGGQNNTIDANAGLSAIGGGWLNVIQSGADQSVIAGGNANHILSGARESFIGGGFANRIETNAAFSSIGAGTGNVIETNSIWGTIAGGQDNLIQPNASYATLGGGIGNAIGTNSTYATIGGGQNNLIQPNARHATIGGGVANIASFLSTVGGGQANVISNAAFGTIGGGVANSIGTNVQYGTIGGGRFNRLSPFAHSSTIGGGYSNSILFNVQISTIAGGFGNVVQNGGDYSFVGGGQFNTNGGYISLISGGRNNAISQLADHSVIGGGGDNRVVGSQALPVYATISGGQSNSIQTNVIYSAIGGGFGNTVQSNAQYATIPGGASNSASGNYSLAGGRRAKASHSGAFVWADSTDADFASTTSNQFNVRATGGVRLETGGAGATIDGLQLLSGVVPSSSLVGTYSGAVTFNNVADSFNGSFTGNGSGLNNVNAATLGGLAPSGYWQTGGNAGTTPGVSFLGTSDSQPFEIRVDNLRALRIEPPGFPAAPNIVGGQGSFVSPGFVGNFIGNGSGDSGSNYITAVNFNVIGGGYGNRITNGYDNFIGGGQYNTIATIDPNSLPGRAGVIGGGSDNLVTGSYATVPGGIANTAAGDRSFAAGNRAKANDQGSFVWADSSDADFTSTTSNQFNVRATGGVRVETGGAGATLDGQPVLHGTIGSAQLSDNAVTTAKIADGSVTSAKLANNSVGSAQLADGLDLGDGASASGFLRIFRTSAGTPGIILDRSSGTIETYGDDGLIQTRLWDGSWGELQLYDNTGNNQTVLLSASSDQGGQLFLRSPTGLDKLYLYGDFGGTARIGIGRSPGVNQLEVEGNASKTVAGSFLANSDRRIKTDIHPLTNALEVINRVHPVAFRYDEEYRKGHPTIRDMEYFNVVAQEFAEVFPDAVQPGNDRLANGDPILQVDTYPATIYSVAAIQELDKQLKKKDAHISALEKQNVSLENRLAALEKLVADMTANKSH